MEKNKTKKKQKKNKNKNPNQKKNKLSFFIGKMEFVLREGHELTIKEWPYCCKSTNYEES